MTGSRSNRGVIRVLVVDDSAFMRRAIAGMLGEEPGIEVVATARNGREGLELAKQHKPDVMTLDIEMPEMDGLTALRRIMRECPTHVIMVSSLTTEGSQASLMALKLGAADVLAKDQSQVSLHVQDLRGELVSKVRALASSARAPARLGGLVSPVETSHETPEYAPGRFQVVLIGASTGGPPLLEHLVAGLPGGLRTPVVIAQHMPEVFTKSLADRLSEMTGLAVHHVEDGMPVEPGSVYLCPGGHNTHIRRASLGRWRLEVNDEPAGSIYKPNVSALFSSGAAVLGRACLGVVLTGIGEDGLEGAREIAAKGGVVLAQSAETCVVYGMPKAVTQAAVAEASLSPEQIGRAIGSLAPGGALRRAS